MNSTLTLPCPRLYNPAIWERFGTAFERPRVLLHELLSENVPLARLVQAAIAARIQDVAPVYAFPFFEHSGIALAFAVNYDQKRMGDFVDKSILPENVLRFPDGELNLMVSIVTGRARDGRMVDREWIRDSDAIVARLERLDAAKGVREALVRTFGLSAA